jgi:hypothetical protein
MTSDQIDMAVLSMLLSEASCGPWAVEEVAREIGDPVATTDGLARLHGAGLVHRCGEFVFASRAAVRLAQIGL